MSIEQSGTVDLASDATCDDGGDGSAFAVCPRGTDCHDCGTRQLVCDAYVCTGPHGNAAEAETACATFLASAPAGSTCVTSHYDLSPGSAPTGASLPRYACECAAT